MASSAVSHAACGKEVIGRSIAERLFEQNADMGTVNNSNVPPSATGYWQITDVSRPDPFEFSFR